MGRIWQLVLVVGALGCDGTSTAPDDSSRTDGGGSSEAEVVWSEPQLDTVYAVTLEAKTIYFATSTGVFTVPSAGGMAQPLLAQTRVQTLAVDASRVYWAEDSDTSVHAADRASGANPVDLAPASQTTTHVTQVTVDPAALYFVRDGVNTASLTGDAVRTLSPDQMYCIANGVEYGATRGHSIVRQPLDGGTATLLVSLSATQTPVSFACDASDLFVVLGDVQQPIRTNVWRFLASNAAMTTLFSPPPPGPFDHDLPLSELASDDFALYVLVSSNPTANARLADLVQLPKDGSMPRTLASHLPIGNFGPVGVDAQYVYYIGERSTDDHRWQILRVRIAA